MSPLDRKGRFYGGRKNRADAAVASAARTTSATGTAFRTDNVGAVEASLAITASSGTTPTLDLVLETSVDGTNFYTAGTFPQKTGVATDARVFGPLGKLSRWKWTIGGTTPSFTFSVAAKSA